MAFNFLISALMLAAAAAVVPEPVVQLGNAGKFAVFATAISSVPNSAITGDIGVSLTAASITGFALKLETGALVALQVDGKVYASDYLPFTDTQPNEFSETVGDIQNAYEDAAIRTTTEQVNIHDGDLTGQTLNAGVYEWTTNVEFSGKIYIDGSATDVFIFKTTGSVITAAGAEVILTGGAKASNIFWQVAGKLSAGAGSHLEGTFLVKTDANLITKSSLNGRILSQTYVALQMATIVDPSV